ncbi:MAG: hypothetical protein SGARI_007786 [Bacillariaceae sp.]
MHSKSPLPLETISVHKASQQSEELRTRSLSGLIWDEANRQSEELCPGTLYSLIRQRPSLLFQERLTSYKECFDGDKKLAAKAEPGAASKRQRVD